MNRDALSNITAVYAILCVAFVVLKLAGVIGSWWWATALLWGPVAAVIAVVSIFVGEGWILHVPPSSDYGD